MISQLLRGSESILMKENRLTDCRSDGLKKIQCIRQTESCQMQFVKQKNLEENPQGFFNALSSTLNAHCSATIANS